jgi:type III restriction enzyme
VDANTVTHVLGVRAFGTQLLCEQVMGRALRRQSYELNSQGLFDVEYADVLGIPFDFTAQPTVAPPVSPRNVVRVHAISPERDASEIRFPRGRLSHAIAAGPPECAVHRRFRAGTDARSGGGNRTIQSGIVGDSDALTLEHLKDERASTIAFRLANRIVTRQLTAANEVPNAGLIMQMRTIVRLDERVPGDEGWHGAIAIALSRDCRSRIRTDHGRDFARGRGGGACWRSLIPTIRKGPPAISVHDIEGPL